MRAWAVLLAAAAAPVLAEDGPPPGPTDPEIAKMVSEISAERIQRSIFVLASFKTRHTLSDPLPSGDGIGGAAAWVRAEFGRVSADAEGRLKVDVDSFEQPPAPPRVPQKSEISNIVATLPGTDPESAGRTLVVSGHYDSRASNPLDATSAAPGADDDASGTAAVLEMARVLSHYKFRATVVFLAVAGEEQGLYGSTHWAQEAKARGADIEAMLDNDIIGSSRSEAGAVDRRTVRLFAQGVPPVAPDDAEAALLRAGGENDSPPRELARAIREAARAYTPSMSVRVIYRADRYLRGGDHLPFLERGFAAVRFTEPAEDYRRQHQDVREEKGVTYGDTPDHVDYAYTADVARVNAAALAVLARAPAPPRRVQIEAARLENDTTLRWAPNTEADLAGYRIVWRETTAPFWEHAIDVPKGTTRTTVPGVSKDNVVFGVEAVDAEGHATPAVFPSARTTL
jgi:hypothetical protein